MENVAEPQRVARHEVEQAPGRGDEHLLLEPTVTSYRGAVEMVDEMLALQRDVLPPIH